MPQGKGKVQGVNHPKQREKIDNGHVQLQSLRENNWIIVPAQGTLSKYIENFHPLKQEE